MNLTLIGAALPKDGFRVTVETHNYKVVEYGRYSWVFEPTVSNYKYAAKFDRDEINQMILDDGYDCVYGSPDADAVYIRFCDTVSQDKIEAGRYEGADFIRITDSDSACGEPYAFIDSSNVWYSHSMFRREKNYLAAVKELLTNHGNGYAEIRQYFAKAKAERGIVEARKAFRMTLFTTMLEYGAYDPNGYGNGSWHAKSEAQFVPCLIEALEAGNN